MDYREKVMAYANVVQIFSAEEELINTTLDAKIMNVRQDPEALEFWTEVRGRVQRRGMYHEVKELIYLEKTYSGNTDIYPNITSLIRSPNWLKWVHYLPKFKEEVEYLVDYQQDNFITEKPTDAQRFEACVGALQFFNDAIVAQKSLEELFSYIPLVTWSIESLLATKQLHEDFGSFLLDNLVPVLRAHRATVLIFIDLIENEEHYVEEERKLRKELTPSNIFNRAYEPKKLDITIPIDPKATNPDAEDPYLDALSFGLRHMFSTGTLTGPRAEQAVRDWYFAPMSHLYRMRMHSDMLGCTNDFTPVMSPKLLTNTYSNLCTLLKIYSSRNLIESSLIGIENLIFESQSSEYKDYYIPMFTESLDILQEKLQGLLSEGLVTGREVADALRRVKLRGEVYGIYNGPI